MTISGEPIIHGQFERWVVRASLKQRQSRWRPLKLDQKFLPAAGTFRTLTAESQIQGQAC